MFDAIAAMTSAASPMELTSAAALLITTLATFLGFLADKRYFGRFLAAYEKKADALVTIGAALERYTVTYQRSLGRLELLEQLEDERDAAEESSRQESSQPELVRHTVFMEAATGS